jgi:hypothetical protein
MFELLEVTACPDNIEWAVLATSDKLGYWIIDIELIDAKDLSTT